LREGLSQEKLVKNTIAVWKHGVCNRNWIYLRPEVMGTEALQQHGWVKNEDVKKPLRRPGTMLRDQLQEASPFPPPKRGLRKSQQKYKRII
jgi:hypothetical protein